jgi:hypothetical protein
MNRSNDRPPILANAIFPLGQMTKIVCLFALLGVSLSAALLPHFGLDELGWVFTHLE